MHYANPKDNRLPSIRQTREGKGGTMQQRPGYDQTLKRLIAQDHDGFLSLVMPDVTWQEDLSSELPDAPRIADFVWKVKHKKERFILHIEMQTKVEPDIG